MSWFAQRPFAVFLLFLALFVGWIGWGWLQQGPTSGELFLPMAKAMDFEQGCLSVHGIVWWTPNYLQGHSLATAWTTILNYGFLELGRFCFGPFFGAIAAYRLVGLIALVLAGIAMYRFIADLTGSTMTATWAAAFYVLCPEFSIRLAEVEHLGTAICFPFVPWLLHRLWRLRHDALQNPHPPPPRAMINLLCVALVLATFLLTTTKIGLLALPVAGAFALWLLFSETENRWSFAWACGTAFVIAFGLVILPLLPLFREEPWMALFTYDPLAQWQQVFTIKTALSWWDRGGVIMRHTPAELHMSGDAFYFGAVWSIAVAAVFFGVGPLRGWLRTREGTLCRLFCALTLFFQWVSYGTFSVWSAHKQILLQAGQMPNWSIALLWLALAAQIALVVKLIADFTEKLWLRIAVVVIYLFTPAFIAISNLPPYHELRAPSAFWNINGSFSLAIAGALALSALLHRLVPTRFQILAGWAAIALVTLDFSAYHADFRRGAIEPGTYEDFQAAAAFLKTDPDAGSVLALSTRYFYLQIPQLTDHALYTEAATSYFQPIWTRALNDAGQKSPEAFIEGILAGGVGFILNDKTDPSFNAAFDAALRKAFPVIFENAHFAIFRCVHTWAPALATGRIDLMTKPDPVAALAASEHDIWKLAPGFTSATVPTPGRIDLPSVPLPLLQPRRTDYQTIRLAPSPTGRPWLIIPESYHPDWHAEADGKELPVYRALGGYLATRAPHDGAQVTFHFKPPWWYSLALLAAAVSWIGVGGLLIVLRVRERSSSSRSA